jgi:drug/metabolite transporter (DMT)-like permease
MALHRASGRTRLGLGLALATVALWATLPLALKLTLEQLDPYTLTWFRFAVAFGVMTVWIGARGGFGALRGLPRAHWLLLAVAALMLIGNYVFYLLGLARTTPANAQLLIQLAPLLMALGGIVVFRERFTAWQWTGLGVGLTGMLVFFRDQLPRAVTGPTDYLVGAVLIVIAALTWAVYSLAQKQLLNRLGSPLILVFIYGTASVLLFAPARPSHLARLDAAHWIALGYCALNTLAAYGAFAEALAHWEASRVSAVLALTPLLTLVVSASAHALVPGRFGAEHIELLGYLGAAAVVTGSALTSLMGARRA